MELDRYSGGLSPRSATRLRFAAWLRLGPGRYVLVEPATTRQVIAGPDGLSYFLVGAVT
jgi:hypothetical protein